jgi:hypothetical protein
MHRRTAIAALLATSTLASAQVRYEIGYRLDDQPEVVRAGATPFSVSVAYPDPGSVRQLVDGFYPIRYGGYGLMFPVVGQSARPGAEAERVSALRMGFGFDDLIFTSDRSGPIEVDLNLDFGDAYMSMCFAPSCIGIEYLTEVAITVNGDTRRGSSLAILDGTGEPIRERTGLLADLSSTRAIMVEGLSVPVNQPVSLYIEFTSSIRFPAGVSGGTVSSGPGTRGLGYAIDQEIFTVPEGVRVDSVYGRIRDNEHAPCFADLDGDGSLTVLDLLVFQSLFAAGDRLADADLDGALTLFDFLAFQNAFDAGCP